MYHMHYSYITFVALLALFRATSTVAFITSPKSIRQITELLLLPSLLPSDIISISPSVMPPVSQSSTCFSGAATLAVDGNTNGNYFADFSVTCTCFEAEPWWRWNFKELRLITQMIIWPRTDMGQARLNNALVMILAEDGSVVDTKILANCFVTNTFDYGSGVLGTMIKIQLPGTDYLSLAEVQVVSTAA